MREKIIPFAERNKFGYWVGRIKYPNGVTATITNAKYRKADALDIVTAIAARANDKKGQHQ